MSRLKPRKRARLPDRAFAYVDARGRRRLPINDRAHVRNALARFNQVAFESDAARDRARARLLNAARKYRGLEELDAMDFLALIKERMKLVEMDQALANRPLNEGFSGGEKKTQRDFANGSA